MNTSDVISLSQPPLQHKYALNLVKIKTVGINTRDKGREKEENKQRVSKMKVALTQKCHFPHCTPHLAVSSSGAVQSQPDTAGVGAVGCWISLSCPEALCSF